MIDMTTHMALSWATIVRKIVAATKQATIGQTITGYPIRTTVEAIAKASRRAAAHTRKRMVTEGLLTSLRLNQWFNLPAFVRVPHKRRVLDLCDGMSACTTFEIN